MRTAFLFVLALFVIASVLFAWLAWHVDSALLRSAVSITAIAAIALMSAFLFRFSLVQVGKED